MDATKQASARALAGVFRALADETRLQMLALLFESPELCVCHFERALEIGQSKASRHLRYLLNAGLLRDRREGVWMHYRLSEELGAARSLILEAVKENLDPALREELRSRLESSLCVPAASVDACPASPSES